MPSLPFSSPRFQLRHLILLLCTACLTLIFANSILLNFTIICMDGPATAITDGNGTTDANKSDSISVEVEVQQRHHFSPLQRSALFSATAVGAILGAVPINLLTRRFSIRRTLTGYGFISGVATLATPLGYAWFGFPALLLSRILQGTSFPAEYMMNSAVSRVWGPAGSTATYLQLVSSHFQLGPIWIMPAASYFCECPWGWAGIYHLQGLLTIGFFLLFLAIFRDHPSEHPWITERELKQIQMGKAEDEDKESRGNGTKSNDGIVPYTAILRDWAVWLLMLALFSDELGFQIYTQLGPYYLNKVLGIGIASAGLFSALPYIVSMVAKLITGPINDRLLAKVMSENGRIKLFAAISQYGIAFSLASLAFLPLITRRLWLIIPFYAMLNAFTGLDFLGVFRCTQTMAGRHSELLIVWESIVSSCVALVLPAVVNAVAPDDSLQQWTRVFACIALIMSICISVFLLFGKTRQRPWAKERSAAEEEKEAERDEVAVHLEKF